MLTQYKGFTVYAKVQLPGAAADEFSSMNLLEKEL
jgi:hypothetical protein